jgi:hypothetical protein
VSFEDQVATQFARANPVPSLDLLEPIEPVDIESVRARAGKSRDTIELKAARERQSRRRPWLVPAMTTVGVIVVAVSLLINVTPLANTTPAARVGNEFMDALNAHDGLAIRGMYALEDQELKWNPDNWQAVTEFNRALGFEYRDVECHERPPISYAGSEATGVECTWALQQDLAETLGLAPTRGAYTIYVSGDEIVRAVETWTDPSSMDRSFAEFRAWVERNHPEDSWAMFWDPTDHRLPLVYANSHASAEPESLDLWERHVDEFVENHQG